MTSSNRSIILVAHNLRSCHNVGSLLRTAEGLGVDEVWLTGYTPYPFVEQDDRLPYIATKIHKQIHKTALGAETLISWFRETNLSRLFTTFHAQGYQIAAIEQADHSIALPDFKTPDKIVFVVGREVEGIEEEVLTMVDTILEIPMFGRKESFNVVQAAAMALYHCRFSS